jgi:hypothetical protein
MSLEDLGNIGEFVAAVGVIISLVYLAVQIRQNTRSSRAASYQAAVTSISDLMREVGADPDLARIIATGGADLSTLTPSERMQFNYFALSIIRNFENIHYQYISGAIDEDTWLGWAARIKSSFATPGAQEWWRGQAPAFSKAFQEFVACDMDLEFPENLLVLPTAPTAEDADALDRRESRNSEEPK